MGQEERGGEGDGEAETKGLGEGDGGETEGDRKEKKALQVSFLSIVKEVNGDIVSVPSD